MQSENTLQGVRLMHQSLIRQVLFDEIEHVPYEFLQKEFCVEENCLCISFTYFTHHYQSLMKQLSQTKPDQLLQNHWISEVLLVMNGQNSNAWNHKKQMLNQKMLDLQRELKFNAAVCYKNKKSSTYYQYRFRVYEEFLKEVKSKQELLLLYEKQSQLLWKILARYFRNYFCWMYRNRLLKLFQQFVGDDVTRLEIKLLHKFIESHPNDYSAYSRLIPIVKKSQIDISEQRKWIQELEDFCMVAFENKESFKHIDTYKNFLLSLESQAK